MPIKTNHTKTILGIDPGTQVMGFAIVQINALDCRVLIMDILKLSKYKDIYVRLEKIHTKISELINLYKPQTFAIEAPFFGKNVQSMLKLGRAQGVAIAAAIQGGLEVTEYSPKKVKQSITGNGNASKEQIWKMLQQQLHLAEKPQYFDATDALAVALCHHYQTKFSVGKQSKNFNGWEDFIAKNSARLKV